MEETETEDGEDVKRDITPLESRPVPLISSFYSVPCEKKPTYTSADKILLSMKKQEVLPEYSITFKVVFAANNSIRHIRMSSIHTLYNLHEIIYEVSGFFEKEHMHMFFMNNKSWSNDDAYDGAWNNNVKLQRSDKNVMLSQLNLYIGKKFLYIFDLGDCWRFRITVIGIDMEHTEKPEIVYSKGRELTQYP